ncbi:MAG: outer membrane protein [Alphaproteobacteria bacterium]
MKKTTLAFLGALASTSIAVAEEAPMPAPQGSACGFSGLYAGLGLGYDFGEVSIKDESISPTGFGGGLFAGWGTEFSKIYLGVELGYYLNAAKKTKKFNIEGALEDIEAKVKDRIEVAARIGYNIGHMLPYAKVGYGWSQGTLTNKTTNIKGFDKRASGFLLGAGLDYKINQKLLVGFGYTYAGLEKKVTGNLTNNSEKIKLKNHSVMLRAAYQF